MIDDGHKRSTFAAKLDHLFRTVRDAQGQVWSSRAAASALKARGWPISHAHINNLRRGKAEPRPSDTAAIADLFCVDPAYFTDQPPRPTEAEGADATDTTTRLAHALEDPAILSVAFRMHDGMSAAGKATIVDLVEHVLRLERQGREQLAPRDTDAEWQE